MTSRTKGEGSTIQKELENKSNFVWPHLQMTLFDKFKISLKIFCWPFYLSSDCTRFCNVDFKPVCGSNGVTYGNECRLNRAACQHQEQVSLNYINCCSHVRSKLTDNDKYKRKQSKALGYVLKVEEVCKKVQKCAQVFVYGMQKKCSCVFVCESICKNYYSLGTSK